MIRIEAAPYLDDLSRLAAAAPAELRPALLVSASPESVPFNRFSVAAIDPILILRCASPTAPLGIYLPGRAAPEREFRDLASAFRAAFSALQPGELPPDFPAGAFSGGLIGQISYECGARFERMPIRPLDAAGPPAMEFALYASAYVADGAARRAWRIDRAPAPEFAAAAARSRDRLDEWIAAEADARPDPALPLSHSGASADWRADWEPSLSPREYSRAVERILDYLRRGDAYQANLTVRHRREFGADPSGLFSNLMTATGSPLGAYLRAPGWAVLSASPELLFDLAPHGAIETRPIKGTIARAPAGGRNDPNRDAALAARLAASAKDRAEHIMIVDLERNDLGRVCRPGSILVDPMMAVESHARVHHLVSSVRGRLREGTGVPDVLAAIFPGGSVTGAPKIRAMEILAELEPVARGIYCGALGWILPEGAARMNLPIRTLIWREASGAPSLDLHVGGGIVLDSSPEAEAEECRLKGEALAAAVAESIRRAGGENPLRAKTPV